jgi:DNA-binding NarL/FixJ family response regulator
MSKEGTVQEIINIQCVIAYDQETKVEKIKNKINITSREKEILELICKGLTNNEIAEKLFISNRTVDNHRANLLEKTETKNTAELVTFVIVNKLIEISKILSPNPDSLWKAIWVFDWLLFLIT